MRPITRVLVVDDRPDLRLSLLYMLEASGYEVEEASDGRQALEVFSRARVDVLLTDLYMPGMDGVGLLRELRDRRIRPPRIVAMTGEANIGYQVALEAARTLGAAEILMKPFTRDQLVQAIGAPAFPAR